MPVPTSLDLAEKACIDQSIAKYSGQPGALLEIIEAGLLVELRVCDGTVLEEFRSN